MSSKENQSTPSLNKDIELGFETHDPQNNEPQDVTSIKVERGIEQSQPANLFLRWTSRIESRLGIESRGIHRVEANEQTSKTTLSIQQIVILWLSINTTSQNIMIGSLAGNFGLGFRDATLCSVLGAVIGCIPVAYTGTFGPISRNRTLITARYTMGWWPVKLCVLLNLVSLIGYSMVGAVICGQILSAVSPNESVTVEVGIAIASILTFLVTTFGIKPFHHYERYAWIPQIAALLILAGTAGPSFDIAYPSKKYGTTTMIANRLSFFSICFSSAITYSSCAADYFVYCSPKITSRWKVFAGSMVGLCLSFTVTFTLGCGLASGLASNPSWNEAGIGSGALIAAGYAPLGSFGKLCAVITALGLVSNMIPPVYCSGIDLQILGRYPAMIPRFVCNLIVVVIFTVCALAGKDNLALIFTNFLAMMGYWVILWTVMALEEELIFRRHLKPRYNWNDWNRQDKLPMGLAAAVAFCVGAVGAALSMSQVYYRGPIARLVGEFGADLGNYVGFVLAGLTFPPLRWLELKTLKR